MSIKGKAYIAGIYEHPTRLAKDISLAQIHAQCAKGALEDAGLTKDDVDGYFCAGDAPGLGREFGVAREAAGLGSHASPALAAGFRRQLWIAREAALLVGYALTTLAGDVTLLAGIHRGKASVGPRFTLCHMRTPVP